ncbi:MAG: hypothetical protein IPN76_29005 [Saprospiraceae bacterium]|nr:hypothetical protein [Saprospiraceae bacterium]
MTTAVLDITSKKGTAKSEIPEYLIYEVYMGQPIYYKGYRDVLNGTKTFEQISARNTLQSWLKTRISLGNITVVENSGYEVFMGKLGIDFGPTDWRCCDIAIYKAGIELTPYHVKFAPEIAIEIDVQSDTQDLGGDMKYIKTKTNQYLSHGTKKVIWIFTNASAVMESTKQKKFQIDSWDKDVEVLDGIKFNIAQMLEARRQKQ